MSGAVQRTSHKVCGKDKNSSYWNGICRQEFGPSWTYHRLFKGGVGPGKGCGTAALSRWRQAECKHTRWADDLYCCQGQRNTGGYDCHPDTQDLSKNYCNSHMQA